jgi:ParB-like chromosome segregation protein Spo0J
MVKEKKTITPDAKLKIEYVPIDSIRPYKNNPRDNDGAVDAVVRSIQAFGFKVPIILDGNNEIVAGHTRFKAVLKLGMTEVPVIRADDLTPEQVRAFRIADNKTAELAEWDYTLLPIELTELQGMDFNLNLLGFSQDELAKLLDTGVKDGLCDPDEIPEPPDEAITQPEDFWTLGDHRLYCGDSGNPEHVEKLLNGAKIQLVNTDPPYNVRLMYLVAV